MLAALIGHFLLDHLRPRHVSYGWLVFGPAANVRALVSVTGDTARDTITIQRFSGEKPVGRKEQFENRGQPLAITLADPDGATSYVVRKAASPAGRGAKKDDPLELFVNVEIKGPVNYRQYCDLVALAREVEPAPVSHFHGLLTIGPEGSWGKIPSDLALRRGGKENDLRAFISTMDVTRGCWVVVKTHEELRKCLFPDGVRPVADIEFPSKKPGDPPIKQRNVLDDFC
ncbi:MAG TPA: hypothetical protein VG125_00115 [Pirellulales bacterium]|nr:hypothetical protein [Pirellulales bacterium]